MEWIKLSEKKPPYGDYLVLFRDILNGYNYSVVTFCEVSRCIDCDELIDTWYVSPGGGHKLYESEIIYWMPLPQPPTGE
ncbi:hypothetical protein [Xenorhabdus szentirmaii]|uniref:hypothetical protein n=1 Tax=Xenorhabdus szentirmaii TaxID=290112 RepID=UPI000C04FAB8|nr:hypothetical protein [Xenorhabdus szentirmaii]